ncbi:MAG: C_GCAxxG_C_C family protein [Clostridium sp.]|nr:C_GCAxxG_C_C family protein [Clostridium sp.]
MTKQEHAQQLRNIEQPHYNCAQSVLIPFALELGLTEEQAYQLASHFGGGMRHDSTCGAVTGALMALGLKGCTEEQARDFLRQFSERHGALDCPTLLKAGEEAGLEKKANCDALVLDGVALAQTIMGRTE